MVGLVGATSRCCHQGGQDASSNNLLRAHGRSPCGRSARPRPGSGPPSLFFGRAPPSATASGPLRPVDGQQPLPPHSPQPPPPGYGQYPPQPPQQDCGYELPDFSVRLDPLDGIVWGRLGLELELRDPRSGLVQRRGHAPSCS